MDTQEEFIKAEAKAIDLLARRNHFKDELIKKLINKGFSKNISVEVTNKMIERGYIKEHDHVLFYIQELKNKKKGYFDVLLHLKAKGIDDDLAKTACKENYSIEEEIQNIQKIIERKKLVFTPNELKIKNIYYLQNKGFRLDAIKKAF